MSIKAKTEFPETLHQVIKYFSDADTALSFVVSMRWPNGVQCPRCGSHKVSFTAKRRVWTCENRPNRRQFSVKIGTIMEDSPIGLDKWLVGIWLITSAKKGISSYELHRALGITQKSAWVLGRRIRFALPSGTIGELAGAVEADGPYNRGEDGMSDQPKRRSSAEDIPLVSPSGFKDAVRRVMSSNKHSSDRQLAEFPASNRRKRDARKRRWSHALNKARF